MSDDNMCYILKEYLNYHEKYTEIYGPKTVVLMMVGQFYELYAVINDEIQVGPDLNELSDILNAQFVRRNKKIKEISYDNFLMMGWPDHALLKFRNILLNNNYTIIKVDQITAPPNPERGVTEIISPSTVIDSYNNADTNYLVSLYIDMFKTVTGDKIYTAGFGAVDISTGKNYVHKIKSSVEDKKIWNDEIYRLIQYYSPKEILLHYQNEEFNFTKETLSQMWSINENNIHINLKSENKQFLKPSYQNEFLKKYFPQSDFLTPIEFLGFDRENEIILSYIYMLQFIYEHKIENTLSLHKPEFKHNSNYLLLSHNCIEQLNVVAKDNSEKYGSLLGILNKCSTAVGRRLCKERILYPILDQKEINKRYDTIELFQVEHNDETFYNLCKPSLKKIIDIEKLHRRMGLSILNPYEFYSLHNSYQYILKIVDILNCETMNSFMIDHNDTIMNMKKLIEDYESIFVMDELEKWSLLNMETSVFQSNIYPEIDIIDHEIKIEKKYLKLIADRLAIYIDKKKEDVVKISYTDKYGYHLYMTKNRSETLKKSLQNLSNKRIEFKCDNEVFLTLKTEDIKTVCKGSNYHLTLRCIEDLSNSILLRQKKLQSLNREYYLKEVEKIFSHNELLKKIVSFIGLVDLYSNCAKVSIENVYKRPLLTNNKNSFILAKDIRHPIVEKVQTDIPYVPNDIELNEDGILLYGTNACGKSTLMKSMGLSLIMAQAGFFVPCSSFEYSPYTSIFTRILNNDNIFRGQSSFAVEMSELRGILLRANEKSLVLGDELCSGTENVSALAIVAAGLKRLSLKKCSFIFTSHLHQLMENTLVNSIENLNVFHLKIIYDVEKDLLIYDRKLEKGSGPPIYGLEVCKAMGLDKEFISLARSVQLEITGSDKNFLSDKQSNYNCDIVMDKCQICSEKSEHTHHIKEQNTADKNNIIGHFHKNTKHNLVPLCEPCHHKVHNENLRIYGYIQTNEGIQLNYEYIEKKEVLLEKNNKKKYSTKDIKTILKYKTDIEEKRLSKTNCLRKLELEDHIQISIGTFNKVMKGEY
jgi:DNA mismatch repair protein MutS